MVPNSNMAIAGSGKEGKLLIVESIAYRIHQNIRIFR